MALSPVFGVDLNINLKFGVGNVVAAILSWFKWHSIMWLFLHFLFGWFYVLYYLIMLALHHA